MSEIKDKETSWTTRFPRIVSKNDLRGIALRIFADRPPEPASKRGMYNLMVFEHDTDNRYTILVTAQDVDRIVGIITDASKPSPRCFTFDETQPWAEVISIET